MVEEHMGSGGGTIWVVVEEYMGSGGGIYG